MPASARPGSAKAAKTASPSVFTTPPPPSMAARRRRSCSATTSAHVALPTWRSSRVEPSMSVKRNVTAGPVGRLTCGIVARSRRAPTRIRGTLGLQPRELVAQAVEPEGSEGKGALVPGLPIEGPALRRRPRLGRLATREPGSLAELVGRRLARPGQVPDDLAPRGFLEEPAGPDHEVDRVVESPLLRGDPGPVRVELRGRRRDRAPRVEPDVDHDAGRAHRMGAQEAEPGLGRPE